MRKFYFKNNIILRNFTAMLLTALLTISFFGCGPGSSSPNTSQNNSFTNRDDGGNDPKKKQNNKNENDSELTNRNQGSKSNDEEGNKGQREGSSQTKLEKGNKDGAPSTLLTDKIPEKSDQEKKEDAEPGEAIVDADTFYVAKKAEGLYFVLERIKTEKDFERWEKYLARNKTLRETITAPLYKEYKYKAKNFAKNALEKMALSTFNIEGDALNGIKSYAYAEIWMAYVTDKEPKLKFALGDTDHIEMSVAVLTSPEAPFQVHYGIFRGLFYLQKERQTHANISIDLHGFIAKVMEQRKPNEKKFVITQPLDSMSQIFMKKLDKTYFRFYNFGAGPGVQYEVQNQEGHAWLQKTGTHHTDANFSLKIVDRNNKLVFELAENDKDKKNKYGWFFPLVPFANNNLYFIAEVPHLASLFSAQVDEVK